MDFKLRQMIEHSDTPRGRAFDLFIQTLIVLSLITFSIETLPNLSATTQASYVHWVRSFAAHIGRSPDQATIEEVRAFQLHLVRR